VTNSELTLNARQLESYSAARNGVAVMDRSAWGRVRMAGEDRVDFLHRMSTNEVRDLEPGMVRRTVLTSDVARIVAIVVAYAFADHLLLVGHPHGGDLIAAHLKRYIFFRDNVTPADVTAETGMLTLFGPQAADVLGAYLDDTVTLPDTGRFATATLDGTAATVTRTDPLGRAGYDVIVDRGGVAPLLDRFSDSAWRLDDATYEVLRIEAGQPAYRRELGDEFNPLEAGLRSIISFDKGCYLGQEVVARLDTYDKLKQHLVGIRLARLPVAEERPELRINDEAIGFLTSWADSPAYGPIALGYVRTRHLVPELDLEAVDAAGPIAGRVVDLPFRNSA
jgi:folate-binding protein YgfZ